MYTFRFIFPVLVTLFIATSLPKPAQAGVLKKTAGVLVVSAALVALVVKGKELYEKQQRWVRQEFAIKLDHIAELRRLQEQEGYQYDNGPAIKQLIQEAEAFKNKNWIYWRSSN